MRLWLGVDIFERLSIFFSLITQQVLGVKQKETRRTRMRGSGEPGEYESVEYRGSLNTFATYGLSNSTDVKEGRGRRFVGAAAGSLL